MTHVITGLCLRDNGCMDVCPVECINAGEPVEQYPTFYIDPTTCIDCGACVPECPYNAIFPADEVPVAFQAVGGELFNHPGQAGQYQGANHYGEAVALGTVRALAPGEVVDLTPSVQENDTFYR